MYQQKKNRKRQDCLTDFVPIERFESNDEETAEKNLIELMSEYKMLEEKYRQ